MYPAWPAGRAGQGGFGHAAANKLLLFCAGGERQRAAVFSAALAFSRLGAINPALQILKCDIGKRMNPVFALVKTRNLVILLSSRTQEGRSSFHANLFQCFQAIRYKPRTHHIHALRAALG
jgi:hypothetical protein